MKIKTLLLFVFTLLVSIVSSAAVSIKEIGGWFESGYVTWNLVDGASTYHVYYKSVNGSYVKLDTELVRDYGTYGRADVLGVVPGSYIFKVVPVDEDGTEMDMAAESTSFAVKAHDRAGFAHFNYSGVGAYKDDGTLKENAKVLYVTFAMLLQIARERLKHSPDFRQLLMRVRKDMILLLWLFVL